MNKFMRNFLASAAALLTFTTAVKAQQVPVKPAPPKDVKVEKVYENNGKPTVEHQKNRTIKTTVSESVHAGEQENVNRKPPHVGAAPMPMVSAPAPKFKDVVIYHKPEDHGGKKMTGWEAFTAKYRKDHPGHTWTGDHTTKEVKKVPDFTPEPHPVQSTPPVVVAGPDTTKKQVYIDTVRILREITDTVEKKVPVIVPVKEPLPVIFRTFAGLEQSWSKDDYAKGHNAPFIGAELELPKLAHTGVLSNVGASVRAQVNKNPSYSILDMCPNGCLLPANVNANNNLGLNVEAAVELDHMFEFKKDGFRIEPRVLGGMKYRSRDNIVAVASTDFTHQETPDMLRAQQTWADFARASLDIHVPLAWMDKKHKTRLEFTANFYGEVNGFSGSHYIAQDAAHSPYGPREKAIYNNKIVGGSAGFNVFFK